MEENPTTSVYHSTPAVAFITSEAKVNMQRTATATTAKKLKFHNTLDNNNMGQQQQQQQQ